MTFWCSMKEAGLLEEVVEDFQKELQEVLKGLQERVCDPPLQVKGQIPTPTPPPPPGPLWSGCV